MRKFAAWVVSVFWHLVRMVDIRTTLRESAQIWVEFSRERSIGDPPADAAEEVLIARVTGRLAVALAVSEICGTYILSPVLAVAGQYAPGGSWMTGVIGGIAGDYFGAVVSFWASWFALNLNYYTEGWRLRLLCFAADVWYLYVCALGVAVLLYGAEFSFSCLAVAALSYGSAGLADSIPVLVWFAVANTVVEVLYLGAAAGFVPQAAKRVVPRYRSYLQRKKGW